MKKLICFALAITMMLTIGATAFAANPEGGSTTLTTSVEVAYTINIPENATIAYGATTTDIGSLEVTSAKLEAGATITIAASGVDNLVCGTATIPYALESDGTAFTSAEFTGVGSEALSVAITEAAWEAAALAGTYTDTITFTLTYNV